MSAVHDRAELAMRTIVQMIVRHILDDGAGLQAHVAEYLRDEFSDVARNTLNEIHPTDEWD